MEEENKKEEVQEEVKEPVVEDTPEVKEEVSTPSEQVEEEKPKKSNKMLFIIIGIALLIIGLCVGFIVGNGFTNKGEKEKGNEKENTVNTDPKPTPEPKPESEPNIGEDVFDEKIELVNISSSDANNIIHKYFSLGLINEDWYLGNWFLHFDDNPEIAKEEPMFMRIPDRTGYSNTETYWYKSNKFTADDLTKIQLIRTAMFNVEQSKKQCFNDYNDKRESYSIEEINEALNTIVYDKNLTIEDIIQFGNFGDNSKFTVDGNLVYYSGPCGDIWGADNHMQIKTYKVEKTDNSILIYQKVAFGKDYEYNNDTYVGTYKYYKDIEGKEYVETIEDENEKSLSYEKYNTYIATFKLINGNYYFEKYELSNN